SMEIQEGESRRFLVEVKPAEATQGIRWESSEPFVAAVKDGELIAIKAGTTTIRAVSLDDPAKVGSAEVTVAAAPTPPPNVKRKESSRGGAGTSTGTGGQTGAGRTGGTGTQTTPPPPPPPPPRGEEPAKPPTTGKAILTITSAPPFAEVILDGRFLGTTPVKEKELTPGKHKILITHRSFPPLDTTITLGPGEKIIRFRLFR
ncbi:MAG TPA: PEGA domain-containing protein, partial [Fibrobacteria bacterium]|nr:PEGA domain-containing protein [Fibrobacteria bacterium]